MNELELILTIGSVVSAVLGLLFVAHLTKVSGRDRPHDPERVKRLVQNAPLERLAMVLNDYNVLRDPPKAPQLSQARAGVLTSPKIDVS
jgi:hypothetical protein